MGVTQAAGLSLRWFRDPFGAATDVEKADDAHGREGVDAYDRLTAEAARISPRSDGLLWAPYLMASALRTWTPNARAALMGLTASHTRGHVVRAILEGVAFSLRDSLTLFAEMGVPVKSIRLGGGGARSPLWRQIQADVYGHEVEILAAEEGAAYGAALLAGVGVKIWSSVDAACREVVRVAELVAPQPAAVAQMNHQLRRLSPDVPGDHVGAGWHALRLVQAQRLVRAMKQLQTVIIFLLCLALVACLGVTPLPKRTRTPQGTEEKSVDLTFIQPGKTTRAEVMDKLKLIDTGYTGDRFFLGRWSSSSAGGWVFLVGMGGGIGNSARIWKSGNLLIEFDGNAIVKKYDTFKDSNLAQQLAPVAADRPPLAGDHVELQIRYLRAANQMVHAKIVLTASDFEFEELGNLKKGCKFSSPAREVVGVRTDVWVPDPDPVYTTQTIQFARDLKPIGGPRGKKLNVEVSLPELVTLMAYVSHAVPAK
jgi:hypothetical protein